MTQSGDLYSELKDGIATGLIAKNPGNQKEIVKELKKYLRWITNPKGLPEGPDDFHKLTITYSVDRTRIIPYVIEMEIEFVKKGYYLAAATVANFLGNKENAKLYGFMHRSLRE